MIAAMVRTYLLRSRDVAIGLLASFLLGYVVGGSLGRVPAPSSPPPTPVGEYEERGPPTKQELGQAGGPNIVLSMTDWRLVKSLLDALILQEEVELNALSLADRRHSLLRRLLGHAPESGDASDGETATDTADAALVFGVL